MFRFHVNPLIPRREILLDITELGKQLAISIHSSHTGRYSNTAQKSNVIFLRYYQKLICFPYLLPQKLSNFLALTEKNNLYPSANPPHFLCELLVRTRIVFTIHSHLLQSYHITSSVFQALIIPKWKQSDNFARKEYYHLYLLTFKHRGTTIVVPLRCTTTT